MLFSPAQEIQDVFPAVTVGICVLSTGWARQQMGTALRLVEVLWWGHRVLFSPIYLQLRVPATMSLSSQAHAAVCTRCTEEKPRAFFLLLSFFFFFLLSFS